MLQALDHKYVREPWVRIHWDSGDFTGLEVEDMSKWEVSLLAQFMTLYIADKRSDFYKHYS